MAYGNMNSQERITLFLLFCFIGNYISEAKVPPMKDYPDCGGHGTFEIVYCKKPPCPPKCICDTGYVNCLGTCIEEEYCKDCGLHGSLQIVYCKKPPCYPTCVCDDGYINCAGTCLTEAECKKK